MFKVTGKFLGAGENKRVNQDGSERVLRGINLGQQSPALGEWYPLNQDALREVQALNLDYGDEVEVTCRLEYGRPLAFRVEPVGHVALNSKVG